MNNDTPKPRPRTPTAVDQEQTGAPTVHPADPVFLTNYRIALDSGAHTLYNFKFAGQAGVKGTYSRTHAKYDYTETEEFKTYFNSYMEFLHQYGHLYEFYVTLDIIGDPKRSWDITKEMEANGLKPIPVFHFGEDSKWLKKMVDEYGYIGIGGLGQDITKDKFIDWMNPYFKDNQSALEAALSNGKIRDILCNVDGSPRVKLHGFAMASPGLVVMYPWWTCDASTWTALARNGSLYIPKPIFKGRAIVDWDYLKAPLTLPVTPRRIAVTKHHKNLVPMYQRAIEEYLEHHGFTYEDVHNTYHPRDILNIRFFMRLQERVKAYYRERFGYEAGGNVLLAGTPSGASTNLCKVVDLLHDIGEPATWWLGSFHYSRHNANLLTLRQYSLANRNIRELQAREVKTRRRGPVERRQLTRSQPPVKFNVTVTYTYSYTVDGRHYAGLDLQQITEQEVRDLKANTGIHLQHQTPRVEMVAEQNGAKVELDSAKQDERPKRRPVTAPTGGNGKNGNEPGFFN